MRALLLAAALLGLTACPDLEESTISTKCEAQYDKCKLPSGPLGVCDFAPCGEADDEKCLKCMPQH